ncbi:MAG: aminoacetone oxidase family FAD-binding enzyme [Bacteroidales bacterium]|nr:aminoacetone oxidase family FAD-binding enzyme [Bacteroidales bacterium]
MKSDIIIIGGGASGLMAAWSAASKLVADGSPAQVTVLEKMPRPARKIMITGKGRCNFSNVKAWNDFVQHIQGKADFVRPAFYNFPPEDCVKFFEAAGMPAVVERGDRAFPASHRASDVVDALVRACNGLGVKIVTEATVASVESADGGFRIALSDGGIWTCSKLIVATGGLSYPGTGSTGDGYRFAEALGHHITPLFPSLTALVPRGYKISLAANLLETSTLSDSFYPGNGTEGLAQVADSQRFIRQRSLPLSELGEKLNGVKLKNVALKLTIEGSEAGGEFGDMDFTDGGIEGPIGFQLSRKAVKALMNGSRVELSLDLKPAVPLEELTANVKALWAEVDRDPRSKRLHEKEKCRILLGKLMPWELIPGFTACNPDIITLERRGRTDTKVWVNLPTIARCLKDWRFKIEGYVGYERAVVTAGGVSLDEVLRKTLESRLVPGLYFCGELLDLDCDTGGYNLQTAFSTGFLAGLSAASSL